MRALVLIPVLDSVPIEDATQHMEKASQTLQSIFASTEKKLTIAKWFSLNKDGDLTELSAAIIMLEKATLVYFGKGWENFKDLQAIHHICEMYGVQRMEE